MSLPLRRAGLSPYRAFLFGQLSGAVEPVAGVLGACLVHVMRPLLPYALAFAEGVLPDAAKVAYHEFRATYNVTVARGDDGAATIDDVLTGFGSALYRLGDC